MECPSFNVIPRQLANLIIGKSRPRTIDSKHGPPLRDTEPDGSARSSIHAGGKTACVDDGHALGGSFGGILCQRRRRRQKLVNSNHHGEGASTSCLRGRKVPRLDEVLDASSLMDRFHERNSGHSIVANTQNCRYIGISRVQDLLDCGKAQECGHPTVIRGRNAASLNVTEDGDSRILSGTFFEGISDVLRGNGVASAVSRAFGNDDDGFTSSCSAPFFQTLDHFIFPAITCRILGSEDIVSTAGYR